MLQHFLFAMDQDVPRVSITFSETQLLALETRCLTYLSRMQAVGKQQLRTREEMAERARRAKQELIVRARKAAADEIDQHQGT